MILNLFFNVVFLINKRKLTSAKNTPKIEKLHQPQIPFFAPPNINNTYYTYINTLSPRDLGRPPGGQAAAARRHPLPRPLPPSGASRWTSTLRRIFVFCFLGFFGWCRCSLILWCFLADVFCSLMIKKGH